MDIVETDYLRLWHELAIRRQGQFSSFNDRSRARAFDTASRRKNRGRQDSLLDFVKNYIGTEDTVLDIGAGTGRWSVPLAAVVSKVTAIEPSAAMADILMQNAREAGVAYKISLVPAIWEDAEVSISDLVVCFHAIYMSADFAAFIRKMEAHAKRACFLGVRCFTIDGVIQELSAKIRGVRHDSPNFIVAYNALYQMGIYANILMEEFHQTWTDPTFESAFDRAKRHLGLQGNQDNDELIRNVLERRLVLQEGEYHWPDSMSTALIWWKPATRYRS
jgi:FkbM family methyltransferase